MAKINVVYNITLEFLNYIKILMSIRGGGGHFVVKSVTHASIFCEITYNSFQSNELGLILVILERMNYKSFHKINYLMDASQSYLICYLLLYHLYTRGRTNPRASNLKLLAYFWFRTILNLLRYI